MATTQVEFKKRISDEAHKEIRAKAEKDFTDNQIVIRQIIEEWAANRIKERAEETTTD